MKLKRNIATDSAIPTSSMADIAFLLIIFFMVTAVFSATRGLDFKLPADDDGPPDPVPAVYIHVLPDRVSVDCRVMEVDQILPYLEPKLVRNPNKPVILYVDPQAPYQKMISVYDLLAETRAVDSPWPFVVNSISIPTRSEVDEYIAFFGANPFEGGCP